ncbi:copia protein [Tanacetum coccineum]
METKDKLDLDQNRTLIDATKYRSMIGALMYLTSSIPDIVHATCLCAWYQAKPTENHLKEVKRIFHYLRGTVNMGLWYTKDSDFELTGISDADYAGLLGSHKWTRTKKLRSLEDTRQKSSSLVCMNDRGTYRDVKTPSRVLPGGIQFLGEKLVSWSLKKQQCTSQSTAEAEYVSLSAYCAQVLWIRTQLTYYGFHFNKVPVYCDSKSAIAISCNPVQYSRTKHIVVRYHFMKEHVEKGTTELYFLKTDYQLADLFTKALPVDRFNYLVCHLGMRSPCPQELDRLAKLHQNRRDLPRDTPLDRIAVLSIKQNLKTVLNFKDTLPQALINMNFLKEHQSRSIHDYLKAKDRDIKFKSKDIKLKIKIQDHKHAKVTLKEFLILQGSKTQDVTRSEAICAMTTPYGEIVRLRRQNQSYVGTRNRGIATTSKGNFVAGQPRVVKCYNCQGEGHMARQCTQSKRPRNAAWFKEKLMLAESQEAGQILDEEQLAFLADPGISEAPIAQQTIPQNSAFQTEDLDAYDSDCDDLSSAKAVLMANRSRCDTEVLSEVPYSDSYPDDMINQMV